MKTTTANKSSKTTEQKIGEAMIKVLMFLGGIMMLPFENRPLLQFAYRVAIGFFYVFIAITLLNWIGQAMYWMLDSFYTWLA
jgi:predicted small integral membrane protein